MCRAGTGWVEVIKIMGGVQYVALCREYKMKRDGLMDDF